MKKVLINITMTLVLIFGIMAMSGCASQQKAMKVDDSEVVSNEVSDTQTELLPEEIEEETINVSETDTEEAEVKKEENQSQTDEKKTDEKTSDKTQSDKKETSNKTQNDKTQSDTKKSKYPYYIKVNRLANCVTVYKQDENGKYTIPIKAMICSVGKNINSTPKGVFKTSAKYTWRYLYGDQYGQYSTRITGPILFHSVPYAQAKKNTLKTNYYNNLGKGDSMGCIRLTCADAKWIYDNCAIGTTVEIYDSSDPGPLGKPGSIKIDVNSPYAGWDPTDPDAANPWKKQKPVISGVKNITVERGEDVDLLSHVSAKDSNGKSLTVNVSGSVDIMKCESYKVTYTATDSIGNSVTASATITVVDTTAPILSQVNTLTVKDSATDLYALVIGCIKATDAGEILEDSAITLDISALQTAMANKAYGDVECSAYATDGFGNQSNVLKVNVTYEEEIVQHDDQI